LFSYTVATGENYRGVGATALAPGKHNLVMDLTYDGGGIAEGGTATILVDGKQGAEVRVEKTVPFRFSTEETLDFGEDTGTPAEMSYDVPFKFTGALGKIAIELK
jgi:arylsulfatase